MRKYKVYGGYKQKKNYGESCAFRPRTTPDILKFRRRKYFSDSNRNGVKRWSGCPQFGFGTRFKKDKKSFDKPGPKLYFPSIGTLSYKAKKLRQTKRKKFLNNRFVHRRSTTPGPGTYSIPSVFRKNKKRDNKCGGRFPFNCSSSRLPKLCPPLSPGPAGYAYSPNKKILAHAKRRNSCPFHHGKAKPMFSSAPRFERKENLIPGPGSYDLEDIQNFVCSPYGKF